MNNHTVPLGNHSDENWDEIENGPTLSTRIIFASAWVIIAVAGIIGKEKFPFRDHFKFSFSLGNGLVIYVAVRFQKMNNVTNCFIVNCKSI